jgi:hypothetical protein
MAVEGDVDGGLREGLLLARDAVPEAAADDAAALAGAEVVSAAAADSALAGSLAADVLAVVERLLAVRPVLLRRLEG